MILYKEETLFLKSKIHFEACCGFTKKVKNEREVRGFELDTLLLLDWRTTTRPTPSCQKYKEGGIEESAHLATRFWSRKNVLFLEFVSFLIMTIV